jgi:glycosyltransferase involved in cell wall biosynthesis
MKLLTITVPSYNVAGTLAQTLSSLCIGEVADSLDIIVVDDGSTDDTAGIARGFAEKYPDSVRIISKENGGHGSAVNAGIDAARGRYFKVVDGDDRLSKEGLTALIARLAQTDADLVASQYLRVPVGGEKPEFMSFSGVEFGRVYDFDRLPRDRGLYFSIHSMTIKTSVLRLSGTRLQEHTFYVDAEYCMLPVPFIKTVEFLREPVYLYYIGGAAQSVTRGNFVRRYEDHYRVVRRLVPFAQSVAKPDAVSPGQKKYIFDAAAKLCFTNYMLCVFYDSDLKRGRARAREFDAWLKKTSPELYDRLGSSMYIRTLRRENFTLLPRGAFFKDAVTKIYSAVKPGKNRGLTYK